MTRSYASVLLILCSLSLQVHGSPRYHHSSESADVSEDESLSAEFSSEVASRENSEENNPDIEEENNDNVHEKSDEKNEDVVSEEHSSEESDESSEESGELECRSVNAFRFITHSSNWCTNNCRLGFCPAGYCSCSKK